MMGTSLLSMPWAIERAGFILGISLLVVMALLTLYTSYLVMKSIHTIGKLVVPDHSSIIYTLAFPLYWVDPYSI